MKTIKRHLPAALLLFTLTGCAIDESYQMAKPEEMQITIKAIREDDDTPETRTVRNEKGKVYWSKGDQISLFYGHGTDGGSVFTSTQEADTVKVTNFVGTITAITGGGEISVNDTYFWGLYPYNETASCDGTSITTTLSSHQVAYPGSYAPGTNISVGRSQGLTMGFYNACGGFRFSLNKEGVKKVTFKGKNGEDLVGKLKISFVNGKVNTEILEGENEVVLEAPAGEYFEPGVLYYFVLAPTVLSSGFTVKAETYTEETTFSYDSSVTIEASNFKSKRLMDTGLTWTQKTGNIPIEDANFKAYLVKNFDKNGDSEISYGEAAAIESLSIYNKNIESLAGIEYMIGLTSLYCFGNQLTNLDVSNNAALEYLGCQDNQLTNLDVSNNTALTELSCSSNQLTNLDVSNNTALTTLYCFNNQLTSLDVSNNTLLMYLDCFLNPLTSLDVSNNSALEYLGCSNNQLTSLDVSNNTVLDFLGCSDNQLTTLDVSYNTALTNLKCHNNQLTSLDVSNNTALNTLYCYNNQLTSLNVSNNTALTTLYCHNNQLTSLDLSNNTELIRFYCYNNQLTTLDVSNNTALEHLDCSPMDDVLISLYISQDQVIPNVTTDRNSNFIPEETQIIVVSGGDSPIGDLPVPEIVDLGLSVKWASSNLEEAGGYFSWGEVYEKGSYFWRTYKWGDGSEGPTESSLIAPVTKYNTDASFGPIDNKTTLDPADDAAHMRLGDKWRMPTYDEWVELINNCDWEYTSEGIIVTSRINGNSICLEISSGNYGLDPSSYEDGFARYWSSSLDVDCPTQAWRLTVRPEEDSDEPVYMTTDLRAAGLAIRPVYAE